MFHDYLRDIPASGIRKALVELFRILDQKPEQRDKYLADDNPALAAFPYVNGGLFSDENIEIPPFTEELKNLLLEKASGDFDWSVISPTIFGAVFESTLNPETRRSGGMHYTSIENIHKVIDPLFLDGLRSELEEIKEIAVDKTRKARLDTFQSKLAGLTFLDESVPRLIQYNGTDTAKSPRNMGFCAETSHGSLFLLPGNPLWSQSSMGTAGGDCIPY